jgi:hypothetical protein
MTQGSHAVIILPVWLGSAHSVGIRLPYYIDARFFARPSFPGKTVPAVNRSRPCSQRRSISKGIESFLLRKYIDRRCLFWPSGYRREIAAVGSFRRLSGRASMLAKRMEAKEFANPAIVTRNCAELCDLIM